MYSPRQICRVYSLVKLLVQICKEHVCCLFGIIVIGFFVSWLMTHMKDSEMNYREIFFSNVLLEHFQLQFFAYH